MCFIDFMASLISKAIFMKSSKMSYFYNLFILEDPTFHHCNILNLLPKSVFLLIGSHPAEYHLANVWGFARRQKYVSGIRTHENNTPPPRPPNTM